MYPPPVDRDRGRVCPATASLAVSVCLARTWLLREGTGAPQAKRTNEHGPLGIVILNGGNTKQTLSLRGSEIYITSAVRGRGNSFSDPTRERGGAGPVSAPRVLGCLLGDEGGLAGWGDVMPVGMGEVPETGAWPGNGGGWGAPARGTSRASKQEAMGASMRSLSGPLCARKEVAKRAALCNAKPKGCVSGAGVPRGLRTSTGRS